MHTDVAHEHPGVTSATPLNGVSVRRPSPQPPPPSPPPSPPPHPPAAPRQQAATDTSNSNSGRRERRSSHGHAADLMPHHPTKRSGGPSLPPRRLGAGDHTDPVRAEAAPPAREKGASASVVSSQTTALLTDALAAVQSGSRDDAKELLKVRGVVGTIYPLRCKSPLTLTLTTTVRLVGSVQRSAMAP